MTRLHWLFHASTDCSRWATHGPSVHAHSPPINEQKCRCKQIFEYRFRPVFEEPLTDDSPCILTNVFTDLRRSSICLCLMAIVEKKLWLIFIALIRCNRSRCIPHFNRKSRALLKTPDELCALPLRGGWGLDQSLYCYMTASVLVAIQSLSKNVFLLFTHCIILSNLLLLTLE